MKFQCPRLKYDESLMMKKRGVRWDAHQAALSRETADCKIILTPRNCWNCFKGLNSVVFHHRWNLKIFQESLDNFCSNAVENWLLRLLLGASLEEFTKLLKATFNGSLHLERRLKVDVFSSKDKKIKYELFVTNVRFTINRNFY